MDNTKRSSPLPAADSAAHSALFGLAEVATALLQQSGSKGILTTSPSPPVSICSTATLAPPKNSSHAPAPESDIRGVVANPSPTPPPSNQRPSKRSRSPRPTALPAIAISASNAVSVPTIAMALSTDVPNAKHRIPSNERYQTRVACVACHDQKLGCDIFRPCRRCVKAGNAANCVDRKHARTRKRKAVPRAANDSHKQSSVPTPALSVDTVNKSFESTHDTVVTEETATATAVATTAATVLVDGASSGSAMLLQLPQDSTDNRRFRMQKNDLLGVVQAREVFSDFEAPKFVLQPRSEVAVIPSRSSCFSMVFQHCRLAKANVMKATSMKVLCSGAVRRCKKCGSRRTSGSNSCSCLRVRQGEAKSRENTGSECNNNVEHMREEDNAREGQKEDAAKTA